MVFGSISNVEVALMKAYVVGEDIFNELTFPENVISILII
jgi:hypothetical protein